MAPSAAGDPIGPADAEPHEFAFPGVDELPEAEPLFTFADDPDGWDDAHAFGPAIDDDLLGD